MSDSKATMFDKVNVKSGYALAKGDMLNSPSLGDVYFERWNRGMQSYLCVQISTGKRYKTRVAFNNDTYNVIGTYKIETIKDKFTNDYKNMTEGDLFLIERKNACEVFKFVSYGRTGKITACSPVDDTKQWGIDTSFVAIKVSNL